MRFDYETTAYQQELYRQAERDRLAVEAEGKRFDWHNSLSHMLGKALITLGGWMLQSLERPKPTQVSGCVISTQPPIKGGALVISRCEC